MAQRPTDGIIESPGGPGIPGSQVRRDANNPTRMTADPKDPPFIDPRIADPAALRYAQGAETRRRNAAPIPKYTEPVAYGPDVPIPRLDGEHMAGRTMREHAQAERGLPNEPAPMLDLSKILGAAAEPALGKSGIIVGEKPREEAVVPRVNSQGMSTAGVQDGDFLPEAAKQDPAFMSGAGSMYATNQPNLARKYGVMRGGKHVPAQMLQAPSSRTIGGGKSAPTAGVSPATLEGLQALADFNKVREKAENNESPAGIEREALSGPAGGAGATGPAMSDAEKKAILNDLDAFDISRFRTAMFKDLLNNDEQRTIIEKRLGPLSLSQLITDGVVMQRVVVHPGVFEPTFQSYSGEEDIHIKRLLSEETRSNSVTDQYALDKYSLMGLTIALFKINNTTLPDYRDHEGNFNEEAFWKKYKVVARFDAHMLASLVANWFWFDVRVRKLWRAEDLGNG